MTLIFFRKRKKDISKDNLAKNLEPPIKSKSQMKSKAKNSDDEDYMVWKQPAPVVTFTPPPHDVTSGTLEYKANLLTQKRLETFNVRQPSPNVPRATFADGDDGFESLNGNNSNGSDGDNRAKLLEAKNDDLNQPSTSKVTPSDKDAKVDEVKPNIEVVKSVEADVESDGAEPTSSPTAKRVGVRFRKSWVQDDVEHDSSDDFALSSGKKKQKVTIKFTYYDGRLRTLAYNAASCKISAIIYKIYKDVVRT